MPIENYLEPLGPDPLRATRGIYIPGLIGDPSVVYEPYARPYNTDLSQCEEGLLVPVTFGITRLGGNIIYFYAGMETSTEDLPIGIAPNVAWYYPYCWYGIAMGKLSIIEIVGKNSTLPVAKLNLSGIYFNDGTEDSTPFTVGAIDPIDRSGNTLTYINRIPGVAHIYSDGNWHILLGPIGESDSWPDLQFIIKRVMETGLDFEDVDHVGAYENYYGANPAAVVYDMLTNAQWGAGVSVDDIDVDSFNSAASYFNDKGYGINLILSKSEDLRSVISKIESQVGCLLVFQ